MLQLKFQKKISLHNEFNIDYIKSFKDFIVHVGLRGKAIFWGSRFFVKNEIM